LRHAENAIQSVELLKNRFSLTPTPENDSSIIKPLKKSAQELKN